MTAKDESSINKALWRFGVISPLLHRTDDDPALARAIDELAAKTFILPGGAPASLSAETLRKWLYRYRAGGFDALADRPRSDKGKHKIPKPLAEAMAAIRKSHPNWTLSVLLEQLMADGAWNGRRPSRASLYRYAAANGLKRTAAGTIDPAPRPFAFTAFGQLWMADFMHGPKIGQGRRRKKAILHAIVDDATRYIVSARFGWHETVETMIAEMMRAVRRFGLCQRFYTDNGPSYASGHLKQVCARLGIHLVHTPPHKPRGRGKAERFFRTVRDRFLSRQSADSLDGLNEQLNRFLADYHRSIHRGLGKSPLQKRLEAGNACRQLPEVADVDKLFALEKTCRVYNDGTIRINRQIFEVPECLPNSRVTVRYLPWDKTSVHYGDDLLPARIVDKAANANRFDHPKGGTR